MRLFMDFEIDLTIYLLLFYTKIKGNKNIVIKMLPNFKKLYLLYESNSIISSDNYHKYDNIQYENHTYE